MQQEVEWIENDMRRYAREFQERSLPDYMWEGISHHIRHGQRTGDFLKALLSNNLADVVSHADRTNMALLKVWVMYLYSVVPGGCWGSRDKYQSWRDRRGLYGIDAKAEKERKGEG